MKIQIEHKNGYREVLYENTWVFILGFATLLLIFFFSGVTAGMLYALFITAILFSESESVTISKRFNIITYEKLWGFGKTKKFKFSDIIQVKISRQIYTEGDDNDLYLIFRDGKKNYHFYSEYKGTENIGIRIAKTIGVDCIYIDNYGESTMLYQANSESNLTKHNPENEPISKDLNNQTLRLEQGWEGEVQ